MWAEQKWRHSRNRLLEKLSCEGGWKLLIPCPACSFPSECAWSVMAAKCRENGQGSTLLELIAMFAILTENGFWLLLFRVPCLILSTKKSRLMSTQVYLFHSPFSLPPYSSLMPSHILFPLPTPPKLFWNLSSKVKFTGPLLLCPRRFTHLSEILRIVSRMRWQPHGSNE